MESYLKYYNTFIDRNPVLGKHTQAGGGAVGTDHGGLLSPVNIRLLKELTDFIFRGFNQEVGQAGKISGPEARKLQTV